MFGRAIGSSQVPTSRFDVLCGIAWTLFENPRGKHGLSVDKALLPANMDLSQVHWFFREKKMMMTLSTLQHVCFAGNFESVGAAALGSRR